FLFSGSSEFSVVRFRAAREALFLERPRELAVLTRTRRRLLLPVALRRGLRGARWTRRHARLRVLLPRMVQQIAMSLEVRSADLTVFVVVLCHCIAPCVPRAALRPRY